MDTKEKLMEILSSSFYTDIPNLADHLIAHGVTVQEWISVDDRLPEAGSWVLCWYEYFRFGEYNRMFQTYCIGYYFRDMWGGEVSNGQQAKVLAWMPLPQPPKGE